MVVFKLGQLVSTAGVDAKMKSDPDFYEGVWAAIRRHTQGDWGDLCDDDKQANDQALLANNGRLLSAYHNKTKIYIITEWDRSATTILFPDEY
jgi:hypothetical protein